MAKMQQLTCDEKTRKVLYSLRKDSECSSCEAAVHLSLVNDYDPPASPDGSIGSPPETPNESDVLSAIGYVPRAVCRTDAKWAADDELLYWRRHWITSSRRDKLDSAVG
jgi:hypothetical protein